MSETESNHTLTARARDVARRVLNMTQADELVTIDEVADELRVNHRNAQKWLRQLEAARVITCERVHAGQAGGRPVLLNRIRPISAACVVVPGALGGVPETPPIMYNLLEQIENKEITGEGLGGDGSTQTSDTPLHEFDRLFVELVENAELTRPPKPPDWLFSVLPPYPDCHVAQPFRTPAQPQFSGDNATDVNLMIKGYRCVYKHRYGKTARVDRKAKFRLKKTLAAFRAQGIRTPYAWAMFRSRQWEHGRAADGSRATRPKIDSIFAGPLVHEHADWFHDVRPMFMAARSGLAPSHLELGRLWRQAHTTLVSQRPATRLDAAQVVASILPMTLYSELAAKAQLEVQRMNTSAMAKLANGDWVWGAVA